MKAKLLFFVAALLLGLAGCKKLIEVDLPIDMNTSETVFNSVPTAVAAMTGIYGDMVPTVVGLSRVPAQMADEVKVRVPSSFRFYRNDIRVNNPWDLWIPVYRKHIYGVNSIIEGVRGSSGLSPRAKAILEGEARFTRAFLYFHLVNYYGDVPLVLTTDFNQNAQMPRSPVDKVYEQIEADLIFARENLDSLYLEGNLSSTALTRLRPNKGAASALLARVYLYRQQWGKAEAESSKLINDSQYKLLDDLDQVFLTESHEAIWQMQVNQRQSDYANTQDAIGLLPSPGRDPEYYVADDLDLQYTAGDERRSHWSQPYPPYGRYFFKYKLGLGKMETKEYSTPLRLAEQFLIRAEARARQGKLTGVGSAAADLDAIRLRAGLGGTTAATETALLDAILQERRIELAMEGGHRWLDLKRTGRLDARMLEVMAVKTSVYLPYKALQPIPPSEFQYNPALRGHQNPGYSEVP